MFKMQVREPQWLPLSSWIGSAFLMFNIKVCIIVETITLIRKPCLLLPQWGTQTLDTSSWIAVCSYFYSDPGHVPCHPHLPSDAGTARPSQIPNLALAIYLDDNEVYTVLHNCSEPSLRHYGWFHIQNGLSWAPVHQCILHNPPYHPCYSHV